MSNLGSALSIAVRALQANQAGLAVASNNIANVNTPGYTRQRVVLKETPTVGDTIQVGTGVVATGVEASRNQLIEREIWRETSGQSAGDLTHQSLSEIETAFNDGTDTGLLPLISNFYNSFQKLSSNPTSVDLRQQVITSAETLTRFIHARAGDLNDLKTTLDQSIGNDVSSANVMVRQIAELSGQIRSVEAAPGQSANDLRDQRTGLIKQLSKIMDVKELDSGGDYQLTTGNNRPLVLGNTAVPLEVFTSSTGLTTVKSGPADVTSEFSGGTLSARVALRDQSIPQYQQSLDQLAYDLARQVNQVHSGAYDQDGNSGINFFTPLAAVTDAASTLQINPSVVANFRRVAASSQPTGSDNQAAIALGNLVNLSDTANGSVVDQYRSLVFHLGTETANARTETDQHASALTQLENRRSSISSVSIDEETTSVLQFQRAYQASARVVSVVDELLKVTLNMGAA